MRDKLAGVDPQSTNEDLRFARRMLALRLERTFGREDPIALDALVVASDGAWFRSPRGAPTTLARKRSMRRLFSVLVQHRLAAPGVALTTAELVEQVWPGERLVQNSGANRLHVAIATLRAAGLRDILISTGAGYALRPDIPVVTVAGDPPR